MTLAGDLVAMRRSKVSRTAMQSAALWGWAGLVRRKLKRATQLRMAEWERARWGETERWSRAESSAAPATRRRWCSSMASAGGMSFWSCIVCAEANLRFKTRLNWSCLESASTLRVSTCQGGRAQEQASWRVRRSGLSLACSSRVHRAPVRASVCAHVLVPRIVSFSSCSLSLSLIPYHQNLPPHHGLARSYVLFEFHHEEDGMHPQS